MRIPDNLLHLLYPIPLLLPMSLLLQGGGAHPPRTSLKHNLKHALVSPPVELPQQQTEFMRIECLKTHPTVRAYKRPRPSRILGSRAAPILKPKLPLSLKSGEEGMGGGGAHIFTRCCGSDSSG